MIFVHICHPWIMLIWSSMWATLHRQAIILLEFSPCFNSCALLHLRMDTFYGNVHFMQFCFWWLKLLSSRFSICTRFFWIWFIFVVHVLMLIDFHQKKFTLFFHWRPMLRMDDSSTSMHTRSLCNGVNNFYFYFYCCCLFIFLFSWVLFSFAIL